MATGKSPAYRWYPRDILGSLRVASMTAAEECWYRRALDFAWLNNGLPADPVKLSRIIGKSCTKKGAEMVLTMFVPSADPAVYVSERQEIERQKQKEWSEKSANGGRKSKPPEKPKGGSKTEPPYEANAKQKGTLQFASSFSASPDGEDAATARAVQVGTILAGIAKGLGLKRLSPTAQTEWTSHAELAVENGFTAQEFLDCFLKLNAKANYPILPDYITERLPAFVKSHRKTEDLPTPAQKEAEAREQNAFIRPAPKPAEVLH